MQVIKLFWLAKPVIVIAARQIIAQVRTHPRHSPLPTDYYSMYLCLEYDRQPD